MNWRGSGISWSDLVYCPSICRKELSKNTKLLSVVGFRTAICPGAYRILSGSADQSTASSIFCVICDSLYRDKDMYRPNR